MATQLCLIEGTAAVAVRDSAHLRIAYDRTRDVSSAQLQRRRQEGKGIMLAVALAVVLVACAISTFVSNARHAEAQRAIGASEVQTIRVAPGDTLWKIAEQHEVPGTTTSDVIEWIKEYNGLSSSALVPGQSIVTPR